MPEDSGSYYLSSVLGLKGGLWVFRKSQKISTASDQYFLSYVKKGLNPDQEYSRMLISYFLILGCVYWNTLLIGNPIDNSLIVSSSACFIYIGTEPGRFTLTNSFPIYVKCI